MAEPLRDAPLRSAQADALWFMLRNEGDAYRAYFEPFASGDALSAAVAGADRDIYQALFSSNRLVGFFMLRGLDAGFARPSFGVYVASDAAGRGVARYALERAVALAGEEGAEALFLKVAEANERAFAIYEAAGFAAIGRCPDTNHLIM